MEKGLKPFLRHGLEISCLFLKFSWLFVVPGAAPLQEAALAGFKAHGAWLDTGQAQQTESHHVYLAWQMLCPRTRGDPS